ncbi:MAG: hypothetical protein KDA78_08280 [Planctomycetaceae bacterium]|nr:hypothetical protein [Planctomycetaceae bacterium]
MFNNILREGPVTPFNLDGIHKGEPMLQKFWTQICFYADFYYDFAIKSWNNITPSQYAVVLLGVGWFGWIMLKSASRK